MLAIKEQVDADPRAGRYLLSGSARVLALRGLPDTLPGRIETIELWPFSQGEIDGTADRFVDAIFERGGGLSHESVVTRQEYAERVVRGGFPEALARTNPARRERFLDSYLADLVAREVSQLSEIERTAAIDSTGFSVSKYESWQDHKWGTPSEKTRCWRRELPW